MATPEEIAATAAAEAEAAAALAASTNTEDQPVKTEAELQAEAEAAAAAQLAADQAAEQAAIDQAQQDGGVNKRFSKLTKAAEDAQRAAAESQRRLDLALETIERLTPKPAAAEPKPAVEDQAPTPPVFTDPDQYQRDMATYTAALVAHETKKAIQAADAARQQTATVADQQAARVRAQQAFRARVDAFKAETPDYDEVAGNPNIDITGTMAVAIGSAPHGPKVAYFLGKNPEEAARISALTDVEQVMEIGALNTKLSAAAPAKPTNAPPPLRVIKPGGSTAVKAVDQMSMDEYAAKRQSDQRSGAH